MDADDGSIKKREPLGLFFCACAHLGTNLPRSISMTVNPAQTLDRRRFLVASALAAAAQRTIVSAADSEKVLLRPTGAAGDLFRVRIEIEAKGNVNVPNNPLVSRERKLKLPITSSASFDYEERLRRPIGAEADSEVTLAERYYHVAKSNSRLNRKQYEIDLRPSVRETIVRRETLPEVIYAVDDYFRHDELELLRVPASSVAIDRLLPRESVAVGSVYQPTREALTSLLNLSSVETSDIRGELVSITESDARIEFRGQVDGSIDGVPTVIRTVGKLTFDRILGTCTWLAMGVHETREIGKAEPGFDVSAVIKVLRRPLDKTIALPEKPRSLEITAPIPQDRLYVDLRSDEVGLGALMDRRWRMMNDVPGAAMMRMIDRDRSIAQCDFRPLVSLEPGAQWTLEALQEDVRRTLGEQLGQFVEADQRVSDSAIRVLRVTAQGAVEGVPIQWVIMHFSDDSGRRLLATFTMEGDNVGEFAGSDIQLANSLRMIEQVPQDNAGEGQPASAGIAPGSSGAAAETANAGANPRNTGANLRVEVQSASDLR
jgi:hypothetical protein